MVEPLYVVALDESERAAHVLDVAVGLALLTRARLLLVHAVGIPRAMPVARLTPEELRQTLDAQSEAHLKALAAQVPKDILCEQLVEDGVAADLIARVARDRNATMVICGTHSAHKRIERALGSTAARIVEESPCSVFVVR